MFIECHGRLAALRLVLTHFLLQSSLQKNSCNHSSSCNSSMVKRPVAIDPSVFVRSVVYEVTHAMQYACTVSGFMGYTSSVDFV